MDDDERGDRHKDRRRHIEERFPALPQTPTRHPRSPLCSAVLADQPRLKQIRRYGLCIGFHEGLLMDGVVPLWDGAGAPCFKVEEYCDENLSLSSRFAVVA